MRTHNCGAGANIKGQGNLVGSFTWLRPVHVFIEEHMAVFIEEHLAVWCILSTA